MKEQKKRKRLYSHLRERCYLILGVLVLVLFGGVVATSNFSADSGRLDGGDVSSERIRQRDVTLTNNSGNNYFIPYKTQKEWESFVTASGRLGVDICGTGVQSTNTVDIDVAGTVTVPGCDTETCIGVGGVLGGGQSCCNGLGEDTVTTYSCPSTGLLSPAYTLNGDKCERIWNSSHVQPDGSPFNYAGYSNPLDGACQNGAGSYNRYITTVSGCSIEGCGVNSTPTVVYCNAIAANNIGVCLGDPNNDGYVESNVTAIGTSGCSYIESIDATVVSSSTTCEAYTYDWEYGSWGACSASCGGGTQTRSKTCMRNDGQPQADSLCAAVVAITQQSCNTNSCNVEWTCNAPGEWGPSGTCSPADDSQCGATGFIVPYSVSVCCSNAFNGTGPLVTCQDNTGGGGLD